MLPSSRVSVESSLDGDNLTSGIKAFNDQVDLNPAVVADYHSLEELCRNQKLQIDRLQTELQSYVELSPRLETYVQQRYLGLWTDRQNMIERLHGFQTELARGLGHDHMVRELKTALSEAETKLKQVEDWRIRVSFIAQQEVDALTSLLAAAEQNLSGDLQAATAKYKKSFNRVDKKLDTARLALEDMLKKYQDRLREQKLVEAELQRLRSVLADRDVQVDRLRSQVLNWEQKCLLAVRDRDTIRTHLAHLASGSLRLPSDTPSTASATAPTGKRSRSTDPGLPIKHYRTAKLTRAGTKSVETPKAKSAGNSPRSAGPVRSAKSSGSDGMPRVSARSSRSTRSYRSTPTSGSARTPTTHGPAGGNRSASQPRCKRGQNHPASVPLLSDTESFESEEDTLAAFE